MNMVPTKTALTGEILSADDDIRVVAALHPLRQHRIERWYRAGTTLAEIVERIAAEHGCRSAPSDFQVHLNGYPVEAKVWHLVRPKPKTTVTMRPVLTGFLAAIFGAIGAFFTGLGFFGQILLTALTIGAQFLLNKLFAPRPPALAAPPKPSFSISGSRNQASPWDPVPVILGKHRVTPNYGALPYTEVVGDEQYLRLLFVVGYGPLLIEDVKIGETPIEDFDDVEVQTRQGFSSDAAVTLYPRQAVEEQLSVELTFAAGYQQRTTAENVTEIAIDITLPNGLIWISQNGRNLMGTNVTWRYRLVGAVPWTTADSHHFEAKTVDTIRKSYRRVVAAGQYEVEVKKGEADFADTDTDTIIDDIYWTALRGFRTNPPLNFPSPLALIAVRIKATSQLNGTVDTLNCVATSKVKAWSGSSWVADTISRNPADLFRHVLQGPANKRPVSDARIDLVALQTWHAYCVTNSWKFDNPRLSAASVYDTLSDICSAGRAMPIFKDGKWSVVWDEQDTPIIQMFTPRNSWDFDAQHEFRDLPHAWRVRFINETKKWKQDERIVYDDGYTAANATRFEGLEFPGVTVPDAIWRHGRFHIAQLRLQPGTYTLTVDFENLISTRGDRVRVAHDVMLVGLATGRVVSVDVGAQSVTIDEFVTPVADTLYQIRFRLADSSFVLRSVVPGSSGETQTLMLVGTTTMPAAGDLFTFGEAESESGVFRVLGIEPQDDLAAKLTLVDDAPGIYLADTGTIPSFESNITEPFDPYLSPPTDIRLTEGIYQEDTTFFAFVRLSWRGPPLGRVRFYEVEYRDEVDGLWHTGPVVTAPLSTADVRGLDAGLYTFRVRCRFDTNDVSGWTTTPVFGAFALNNPPADVLAFRISTLGDLSTLSWTAVLSAGVTYEIRFVGIDSPAATWNTATPLIPSVSGTSVQVPTMIGTYLIKAVLPSGLSSVNATLIESSVLSIVGLNVVEILTESPAFAGVKFDTVARDGELRLAYRDMISNWETLSSVTSLWLGDGDDDSLGLSSEGFYYFDEAVDLGDVFTSRLSATIEARGSTPYNTISSWSSLSSVAQLGTADPADWSVTLEYRSTLVDPIDDDWTAWQTFIVGDVAARAFEFRMKLNGRQASNSIDLDYTTTTPVVTSIIVSVDMPDLTAGGNDLVVTVAGRTIVFDEPFRALRGLGTNDQDMQTGDYHTVTAKSATGFTIQFFNAGGSPVERTFDYVAKGYGRLLS